VSRARQDLLQRPVQHGRRLLCYKGNQSDWYNALVIVKSSGVNTIIYVVEDSSLRGTKIDTLECLLKKLQGKLHRKDVLTAAAP
jgi:hypothetical protein